MTIGPTKPCWDEIGHHLHTYKSDKNDGKLIGTVSNQGTSHIPWRVSKNVVIFAGHDCILSHIYLHFQAKERSRLWRFSLKLEILPWSVGSGKINQSIFF